MAVGQARIRLVLSRLLALQGSDRSVGISQKKLASDIGLAPPVISMAMAVLRNGGYIRQNADRSWSVSETPVYDNSGRIDTLLAEVRQLKELIIEDRGRIALPARPPVTGAGRLQPASRTTAGPMPERAVVCAGRPVPAGRLTPWHERDDRYPFKAFIADAFAYDARGVVFALQVRGSGDDADPYPVRRGYVPREGGTGDTFILNVGGIADFKTASDLRDAYAARINKASSGATLDWTSWLTFTAVIDEER